MTQKGDAVVGSRSSGARDSKIGKATIKTILVASVDADYGVAVANIASNTDSGSFSPILVGYTPPRSDLDRFENGVFRSVSGYGDVVIAKYDVAGSNIAAAISSVMLGYVPPCSVWDSKRPSSDHGIAVFPPARSGSVFLPPARSGSVFLPPLRLDLGSIVRCVTKVCRFSPIRSDLFLPARFVDLKRVGDPVNPMSSGGGGGGGGGGNVFGSHDLFGSDNGERLLGSRESVIMSATVSSSLVDVKVPVPGTARSSGVALEKGRYDPLVRPVRHGGQKPDIQSGSREDVGICCARLWVVLQHFFSTSSLSF